MTALPQHPDLHELIDQLNPAQADAVRAVVVQLIPPPVSGETDEVEAPPRKRRELAFAAVGATKHGITTTMEQAVAEGFGRDWPVLIVDTGVLVATADTIDPHHRACLDLRAEEPEPLVTTAMVIAEAAYLLDPDFGPAAEAELYLSITRGQLILEALTIPDWQRVHDLVVQYADLRLGGTDASLIALAERHHQQRVATLNTRHFRAVRPAHAAAFTVLPADLA